MKGKENTKFDPSAWAEKRKAKIQKAQELRAQQRTRLIAARPATIWQLQHARALRVARRVTVREAMDACGAPPPARTRLLQGPTVRVPNPHRIRSSPATPGYSRDDHSQFYDIDLLVSPTVTSGHAFAWLDEDYVNVGYLSLPQTAALMTVGPDFAWATRPRKTTGKQKLVGLANAIPPLFMAKVFDAATTLDTSPRD